MINFIIFISFITILLLYMLNIMLEIYYIEQTLKDLKV